MGARITALIQLSLLVSYFSSAQQVVGRISDQETNEPVPFAHVAIGKVVTISNEAGEFMILRESEADSLLQVSFIGYEPVVLNISKNPTYNIKLTSSTLSLSAVTVLTGDILMQHVFNHLITNYEMEATRLTSYYKEKLITQDSLVYLAEGILDILSPPNISGGTTKISPLRTRKVVLQKLDPERATMMSGHAYDMIKSSIWRENSFLSKANRKHYSFEYEGKRPYQKHSVYEVSFAPKDNKGYVSGKLFIEDETYAIIKMIYEPKTNRSNFWDSVKWTEEFEFINGRFNLTAVSYKGAFSELGKPYEFYSLLINNSINSTAASTPEQVMDRKDIFVEKADFDFTEDFWSGYNFIKLTAEESSF